METTRKCITCNEDKLLNLFYEKRNVCNKCRYESQKKRNAEKTVEVLNKTCSKCNVIKPSSDFQKGRNQCYSCRYSGQKNKHSSTTPNEALTLPHDGCNICGKQLDLNSVENTLLMFEFKPDKGSFAVKCKECRNKLKPWESSRKNKRETDEETFLKNNAMQQQKHRDNNPDLSEKQTMKRKNDVVCKLNHYRNQAKTRGKVWCVEDEAYFSQQLQMPCFYCGDKFDELNGLDRIDNDYGYCKENVVACCSSCNMIKGSYNIEYFIEKVNQISNHIKNHQDEYNNLLELNKNVSNKANNVYFQKPQPKKRMVHQPDKKGKTVVFYRNNKLNKVAYVLNSLTDASELVGITKSTGWAKFSGSQNIWVKPNWLLREKRDDDIIDNDEKNMFENDLRQL